MSKTRLMVERKKICYILIFFVILACLNGCADRKKITKKMIEETPRCLYGLFMTNPPINIQLINEFELETEKKAAIIMFYTNWQRDFPKDDCLNIINHGAIAHITWEPWIGLDGIIEGKKDEYIISWAKEAKDFGFPFFLRWAHEMNGNWYPWSGAKNSNDPSKYIKAYHHIHKIFERIGAHNVIWVWSPMDRSIPTVGWNNAENYYPGDRYVDWLGIDGYNWGTTQSWSQWIKFDYIFRRTYDKFAERYPNKPIMIAEFASAEKGGNKSKWIMDALDSIKREYPQIKAIVWFNIDKECDWRINSSPESLESFKTAIKGPYYISKPNITSTMSIMDRFLKGFRLPEDITAELD